MGLSDKAKEKLNESEIIKKMSEHVLLTWGKTEHSFSQDHGSYYFDVPHSFRDFPDLNIHLYGLLPIVYSGGDLGKFNREMADFLQEKSDSSVVEVLNQYNHRFKNLERNFSSISVNWNEKGKLRPVFQYYNKKPATFKQGPWQEHLAKIYQESLGPEDAIDSKTNILLRD